MNNAKLLTITIRQFKSFKAETHIELAPLTIILGRNNSGKSTIIQSLLLLKQTLNDVRPDVMLGLEGVVDAFSLRELTSGWPKVAETVEGPTISLEWECEVEVQSALRQAYAFDHAYLAKHSQVPWLATPPERKLLKTAITLRTKELRGAAFISSITLKSFENDNEGHVIELSESGDRWVCNWKGRRSSKLEVELNHFIPHISIDRSALGPRHKERAWHNAYLVLFAQPLDALKKILTEMHYLGSGRQQPPSLFKAATTAPNEIGVSGELAAQLLHRRQKEIVHFLPPLQISDDSLIVPNEVFALPLVDAVNKVMSDLSIRAHLRVEEIKDFGFRLMFGEASLAHVGRGLGYLLPLVELGLFADPLRFTGVEENVTLEQYRARCDSYTHIAVEEPEAHLHPKVASRLAHWLVSLARANRRMIIETHSDHLVRRLRGLAARAKSGSELETWLRENVAVLSVEQDRDGFSTVTSSRLTAEGGVTEIWPADFMDEAPDEESAIYYAKLDKTELNRETSLSVEMVDGPEPESDEEP